MFKFQSVLICGADKERVQKNRVILNNKRRIVEFIRWPDIPWISGEFFRINPGGLHENKFYV